MSNCNATGYSFAGVQGGSQCLCTNEHPMSKTAYESCNVPCSGDGDSICGGNWMMNLYGATSPPLSYLGCYTNTLDRLLTGTYENSATNSPIEYATVIRFNIIETVTT